MPIRANDEIPAIYVLRLPELTQAGCTTLHRDATAGDGMARRGTACIMVCRTHPGSRLAGFADPRGVVPFAAPDGIQAKAQLGLRRDEEQIAVHAIAETVRLEPVFTVVASTQSGSQPLSASPHSCDTGPRRFAQLTVRSPFRLIAEHNTGPSGASGWTRHHRQYPRKITGSSPLLSDTRTPDGRRF
jgi:hypothetical protein